MATFLALLVVMAAVGLLLRAFVVDAFAQTATTGSGFAPEVSTGHPVSPTSPLNRPGAPGRSTAQPHRLRPDALVWNAIDDLQVRRLLSGSPESH